MEFLTVKELAELKGCSERYIKKIIQDGKLLAEQTINEKGRPKYLVPVSSLTEDLKSKYYKGLHKEIGLLPELIEENKKPLKQPKKTVRKTLDEFTSDERDEIALWCSIIKEWQGTRAPYKNKCTVDTYFCGKIKLQYPDINISPDILYRKYAAFKENNLEGLTDNRGGWNKGKTSVDETVFSIFTSYYLTSHRLTVDNCYNKTVAVCKEYYPELICSIPSSRTFRRQADKIPAAILEYARFGEKAFLDNYLEYAERSLKNTKCNDIWIADNHTLDFFTLSDDGKAHRPSITTFQDAKSGIIVAAELCDHPNSDTTRIALRSAILKGFGIPLGVYFDNGSEFLTKDIAGRGHRKKSQWQKEEHPVQILSLLGIKMTNAIPKNAKAKPIERFFETFKEHYSKSMESYCGGTPSERPDELDKLIKNKQLITDAELREILPVFIKGHNSELYGGKEKHYKNSRRIDVWNEAIESGEVTFRTTDEDNLNLLLRRTTNYQQIKRNGVYIEMAGQKLWFKDDTTVFHIGEEVYVRFDPANLQNVKVYDKQTDKLLYTYPSADHLSLPFINAPKEDIQALMRSQRNTKKAVKAQLKEYTKFDAVSLLKAELLRAEQNSKDYRIAKPDSFVPVIANELEVNNLNITKIEFADIKKLNDALEKSKGA